MLQDDDDDQLTRALGLNACYNFYLTATEEDFKKTTVEEEDEDIVYIKSIIFLLFISRYYFFRLKSKLNLFVILPMMIILI
jgi:hypothetical protein